MTQPETVVTDDHNCGSGIPPVDAQQALPATSPVRPSPRASQPTPPKHRFRWLRYTLPGSWVAVTFVWLSFTPSLVPRPGAFQGVVCGITGAIGYGLGVTGAWVWREFADRPARRPRPVSWRIFWIGAGTMTVVMYLLGQRWQGLIRDLVEASPESVGSKAWLPVVAVVSFVGLVAAGRGVRACYRWVARHLRRWIGDRAARTVGWILAFALTVGVVSGVLVDGVLALTDRMFAINDTTTSDTAIQPTMPLRSGGPQSLIPWDTLGYQGRNFVGKGPTRDQISTFTGKPALAPIRAYAGIASEADVEKRAQLAVADLERAGGFGRHYLLIAGTTGTGWVDPAAINSFEYETGGDSAAVGIQYSYLPSWASFLVDQTKAREAGRALFDAVYRKWSDLPQARRPEIFVFGLSLGSFAMESPFSGEADMANRTAGILLAGPPSFNVLNREFTDQRDPGSPEIQPIYRSGRTVRFTNQPAAGIPPHDQSWTGTRVLYLQHASDPVVWLSPDLILHRPDWLAEPAGPDVTHEMVWIPFVTFWQVTMDLLEPVDTPPGHGHTYTVEFVDGWATVLQPSEWTEAQAEKLKNIISQDG